MNLGLYACKASIVLIELSLWPFFSTHLGFALRESHILGFKHHGKESEQEICVHQVPRAQGSLSEVIVKGLVITLSLVARTDPQIL